MLQASQQLIVFQKVVWFFGMNTSPSKDTWVCSTFIYHTQGAQPSN